MKVLILGASGMLGSLVLDHFARQTDLTVTATVRPASHDWARSTYPQARLLTLDAAQATAAELAHTVAGCGWVVNAIGIIKPFIHDDNSAEVRRALEVNALFPIRLAEAAAQTGARVLQIATDCVFSGKTGFSTEATKHDALDVYGKTKSLGEVPAANAHHLRCSIIGPERRNHVSLLHWFLRQPQGATVKGFENHLWNGVTTLQFAKIARAIVAGKITPPPLQHIVPTGHLTKCAMLHVFARAYRRQDITIQPVQAADAIDRTLATLKPDINQAIWAAAGYAVPPTVPEMIEELARDCAFAQE